MSETISAKDACQQTGLASSTLTRFAEAGYLKSAIIDGETAFYIKELQDTFGVKLTAVIHKAETIGSTKEIVTGTTIPEEREKVSVVVENIPPPEEVQIIETKTAIQNSEAPEYSAKAEMEIFKLQKVVELQEQLLKAKDNEIVEVRKQRDWLQERIEKLEIKAERDQLLLLSETRTVQKLIDLQQKRRSPILAALGWLGVKSQQNQGDTIEMQKKTENQAN